VNENTQTRIDTHCHLWDLARGDYGWLDVENPELQPIARNFTVSDLHIADSIRPASQYVVVQAAPTVEETEYLLQLSEQHHEIGAVVGWLDLSGDEQHSNKSVEKFDEQLERLSKNPKFKGIRPMLQDIEDVDWINTVAKPSAIDALTERGLRFDALVLPQHLKALKTFALAHPNLPLVIDHAAKPALAADPSDPRHAMWRDGMIFLAKETNSFCKVSGLLTELSAEQRQRPLEYLQPVVDDLLNWFGPDRLMWGSDWPVLNLASSYDNWHSMSKELLSELDAKSCARIFSGSATEFYKLSPEFNPELSPRLSEAL